MSKDEFVPTWYLRDGTITHDIREWGRYFHDMISKRVAETTLPDGKWVSTVWVGMELAPVEVGELPLICETIVFPSPKQISPRVDYEYYATEAEAMAGHLTMVAKWQGKRKP